MKKALKVIGAILSGAVVLFGASAFITGNASFYPYGVVFMVIGAVPMYFCLRRSPEEKARAAVRREAKAAATAERKQWQEEKAAMAAEEERQRQEQLRLYREQQRAAERAQWESRSAEKAAGVEERQHQNRSWEPPKRVSYSAMLQSDTLQVQNYAVVDVETTGLNPESDEIIEIAAIRSVGGQLSTFCSFVKPRHGIPAEITKLTGISNADVKKAPKMGEVAPQFASFVSGLPLVAHNAPFDIKFIAAAFDAVGIGMDMQYIDTLELSRVAFPSMHNYKLSTLIRVLHLIDGEQQHRAGSDTEATLKLFELCRREIPRREEREQRAREKAQREDKAYHLNQYGMQAEASGDVDRAIGYYEDIVTDKAIMPNAYMRLAVLYKKRQQWLDVVRVCDAALSVLPGTPGKLCQPEEYEKRKAYAMAKLGIDPEIAR